MSESKFSLLLYAIAMQISFDILILTKFWTFQTLTVQLFLSHWRNFSSKPVVTFLYPTYFDDFFSVVVFQNFWAFFEKKVAIFEVLTAKRLSLDSRLACGIIWHLNEKKNRVQESFTVLPYPQVPFAFFPPRAHSDQIRLLRQRYQIWLTLISLL